MSAVPVSRPWQGYLRFSLRGLIVLIVGISVWLAWLVHITRIQREAVAAIQEAGGSVAYDWKWSNGNDIPGGEPWAPWWLVDLVGVDYFGHVTDVWLNSSSVEPGAAIVQAGRLTQIERLILHDSSVRDADLADLKGLTKLSALDLYNTHVTDAGLSNLKGLTKLSALILHNTHVTDAGLVHLKGLSNLSELGLYGTRVTDAGVKELQQALPNLKIKR